MTTPAARSTRPPVPSPWVPKLAPGIPPLPVRRFTLDEYHRLIAGGFFHEDEPFELLNGWITYKMPINPPHAQAVRRLNRVLSRMLPGDDWLVSCQQPVSIETSDSEPEPDVAIVAGPDDRYDTRHPTPADTVLAIEVADSSLVRDQTVKLAIYAAAKVPVYWVVNIPDRRVEVYTNPRGGKTPTYRAHTDYLPGQSVPVTVAGKELGSIPVSELLP